MTSMACACKSADAIKTEFHFFNKNTYISVLLLKITEFKIENKYQSILVTQCLLNEA